MRIAIFILFLIACYAFVPFIIRLFLDLQVRIGNDKLAFIHWMNTHRGEVVILFWILMTIGIALALPAMMKDGFFNS